MPICLTKIRPSFMVLPTQWSILHQCICHTVTPSNSHIHITQLLHINPIRVLSIPNKRCTPPNETITISNKNYYKSMLQMQTIHFHLYSKTRNTSKSMLYKQYSYIRLGLMTFIHSQATTKYTKYKGRSILWILNKIQNRHPYSKISYYISHEYTLPCYFLPIILS